MASCLGYQPEENWRNRQQGIAPVSAGSGVAADDAGAAGICKLLGGWPVALRIAGRYLSSTGESAADYLQWLEQEPFKELASGQHQEENAALLLRRSVDAVSADARLALGLAGCLAFAPLAREPVAAILDDDERRARNALNELVNYGLLEKREERWQISHALVHTYARTALAMSRESVEQLAGYYAMFCYEHSKAGLEGYARLDEERAHSLRLIESCLASKLLGEMKLLVWVISEFSSYQEEIDDELALQTSQQSLSILGEWGEIGDRECAGWTEQALHDYEQILPITRKIGNKDLEGATLNDIGLIYHAQGEYAKALECHKQALAIRRDIGDRAGEAESRWNIGNTYIDLGDLAAAEEYISRADCRADEPSFIGGMAR